MSQPGGTPTTTTTSSNRQQPSGTDNPQGPHEVASRPEPVPEAEDSGNEVDMPPAAPFEWQKGKLIGQGAFGRVYKGLIASTGQEIAVKQVRRPGGGGQGSARWHVPAACGPGCGRGPLHAAWVHAWVPERKRNCPAEAKQVTTQCCALSSAPVDERRACRVGNVRDHACA